MAETQREYKSAKRAWEELHSYRWELYDRYVALYTGDHDKLASTGKAGTFWNRTGGKSKIHMPLLADIASTSAALLFGQEPTFTVYHEGTEMNESDQQHRLEDILDANSFESKLSEAAESCSALGDVYFKLRWNKNVDHPLIDLVQADSAWAEYVLGDLVCLHTFNELYVDREKDEYIRIYERYTRGNIHMEVYKGCEADLGLKMPDTELKKLGYETDTKCPIDDIMAVHVANVRPNRRYRWSMLGRSDFDGLRDLSDALDETYSSWIRDVRLAKAKLIVPVEYLRRKPQEMLDGVAQRGSWEFDPDIETYVAMDIQTNDMGAGNYITPSQFAIRSGDHAATVLHLIQMILQTAGYSPQTFGLDINGSAQSGTALNIRERKSCSTRDKKQPYWIAPIEKLLTNMVRLDHALYPNAGSDGVDTVRMKFADGVGYDMSTMAATAQALFAAQSASASTRVRMQHPDWTETEVNEEVDKISKEFQIQTEDALTQFADPMAMQMMGMEEPTE